MTFEEFMKGTEVLTNSDINIIRRMCYEIHMLDISDSTSYKSFNEHPHIRPLSEKLRHYMDRFEDGEWT